MLLDISRKSAMRCLILLFAIYCVCYRVIQAQDCEMKYYSVNSIGRKHFVNVTCYATISDCNVYVTKKETGCTSGGLIPLDKVPANETKLMYYSSLDQGYGICSDHQISVHQTLQSGKVVHLPKASDSGTKFHMTLQTGDAPVDYTFHLAAMSEPSYITLRWNTSGSSTGVGMVAYRATSAINHVIPAMTPYYTIEIEGTAPIVVAVEETIQSEGVWYVLQPISSEPVMVYTTENHGYVSISLSDCSTNKLISDPSAINARFADTEGRPCGEESDINGQSPFIFHLFTPCLITVTPINDNTCVSVLTQNSVKVIEAVGMPVSKLPRRLGNRISNMHPQVLSLSNDSCYAGLADSVQELQLDWIPGVYDSVVAQAKFSDSLESKSWISCPSAAYFLLTDVTTTIVDTGYQSEEHWVPFFVSEGCIDPPPTEPPTSPPVIETSPELPMGGEPSPPPTEPPTSPSVIDNSTELPVGEKPSPQPGSTISPSSKAISPLVSSRFIGLWLGLSSYSIIRLYFKQVL